MECDVVFFSDRKSLKILSVEFLPFEIKQQHQRKEERCVTTEKTAAEQTTGKSQSYNAVNGHPTLSRHTPRVPYFSHVIKQGRPEICVTSWERLINAITRWKNNDSSAIKYSTPDVRIDQMAA